MVWIDAVEIISFVAHCVPMTSKVGGLWNLSLQCLFVLGWCLGVVNGVDMPATGTSIYSPPEGNTTFIDGTTWCVASPGASQQDLQNALDWACGPGMADCSLIQPGQVCFQPDTLLSHASYAFNSYYQQNGDSPVACNFGGTGMVVTRDPSFGACTFPTSGNGNANDSRSPALPSPATLSWLVTGVLILVHLATAGGYWGEALSQLSGL